MNLYEQANKQTANKRETTTTNK